MPDKLLTVDIERVRSNTPSSMLMTPTSKYLQTSLFSPVKSDEAHPSLASSAPSAVPLCSVPEVKHLFRDLGAALWRSRGGSTNRIH